MLEEKTEVVREYVEAVFRRGREPMEPIGFTPDFGDQPSRHKTYLGVSRFPLPAGTGGTSASAAQVLATPPVEAEDRPWTLESLATLLRLSYGVLDRRLRVNWNQDSDVRVLYPQSLWGRAAASGGGMYPLEIYWVAGQGGPLTPGVYHYSTAHHAFERLLTGDLTDEVRAACADAGEADGFLLVSVRFWKNSFKYNSFCYHVVTQDAGALLGCWELLARGLGRRLERVLWFDDERLNRLLGVDTLEESVLAVVPMPFARVSAPVREPVEGGSVRGGLIDRPSFERSSVTRTFEQVEQVHRAVLDDRRDRPDPTVAAELAPRPRPDRRTVPLPAPDTDRLDRGLEEVLRSRQTSFGSFVGSHPLGLGDLATVLAGTVSARHYASDVAPPRTGLTGLYVLANRVAGLGSGAYRYDPDGHRLQVLQERPLADHLQRSYYLSNYNIDQVGAVLAISARWESILRAYGSRGYRVVNSEVGAVAQTAYVAASALGVGCGTVLGFDNIAIDEAVGLDGTDERTFLFVLLGHERADRADFDSRLV
ncbi:SagB family peptide dehydrogenase [Streptomyces sp. TP-A0874]|uniref:SagB family peptide dehydrogenase n=1 Tax=Streptomyces sp. TP-A0874 TaxID=549819 RepID=UPI000852D345|nr:SagB family peptide dehydrogenase [Streptomyces sp. TP-A0874]